MRMEIFTLSLGGTMLAYTSTNLSNRRKAIQNWASAVREGIARNCTQAKLVTNGGGDSG